MQGQNSLVERPCFAASVFTLLIASVSPVFADPISLMWDASPSVVTGYLVHVGTQPGTYTQRYDVGATRAFTFPNATAGQRYCFAVSAYSGSGEGARSAEVCGYSDAPPVLTNPGNQASVVGSPVTLQLAGSDPYGQPVTYSATGLPPGVTLASTSGFISGVGTTTGTYAVTAWVSDGRLSASQPFNWTMSAPPSTAPSVTITSPTSTSTYATTGSVLTLRGTASADAGVAEVRWMSDRGGSGTASGTTSWSVGSVPLQSGVNMLTVLARDAAGREAADVLNVTYTIPVQPVMLSARPSMIKGKKSVALTWTGCAWRLVDVVRDGLPLTTTENDGSHTDLLKRAGSYTYRICETGNRTNCSNIVTVYF